MHLKRAAGWSMVTVFAIASLSAAGSGLGVVEAVKAKNQEALRALLSQGADVNAPQADGATALHWAAYWDDLETADRLIRAGARANVTNDLGATPLWVASLHGSTKMIERLLDAGADPNAALPQGETPLMTASRTGIAEAVTVLLAHGANANATERVRGQTALMWAAAGHHPAIVRALLAHGADVGARSSVRRRSVRVKGSDKRTPAGVVDEEQGGFTPLLFAARAGDLESARLLLAAGANANDAAPTGASVLVVATHSGHAPLAAWLLARGADPNTAGAGYTALHAAVLRGDGDSVNALLARGAQPNVPLLKATPVINDSLDWSMSLEWIGATPFWLAAKFGEINIMRALLASGADPLLPTTTGTTPLMAAIAGVIDRRGTEPVGKHILAPDPAQEERTILDVLRMTVELGADVNAANTAGETALHGAASRHLETVVQFLAEHGATLDAKDQRGDTPLALVSARHLADYTTIDKTRLNPRPAESGGRSGPRTADLLRKLGATE